MSSSITKNRRRIVAYARTSTNRQDLGIDVQLKAFESFNPDYVVKEKVSGRKDSRNGLDKILKSINSGDCLLIYKLDRLSRSTKQLVNLMAEFNERDIQLLSISDGVDTTTTNGRFLFTIMSGIAQMEAEMISKRTKDALAVTNKKLGRPRISKKTQKKVLKLYTCTSMTVVEISKECKVSVRSIYRLIKDNGLSRLK